MHLLISWHVLIEILVVCIGVICYLICVLVCFMFSACLFLCSENDLDDNEEIYDKVYQEDDEEIYEDLCSRRKHRESRVRVELALNIVIFAI